jgi:hypothetical protein
LYLNFIYIYQGSPNQAKWAKFSIPAEVALPRLQSEIKVALFLFASRSFLAKNLTVLFNFKISYKSGLSELTLFDIALLLSPRQRSCEGI